ncbi:hypothetical protein NPIL_132211 [Nephila pilipes]|uniref:Uncharacterized protein n=1 Tax=Nephila pilipes TaxID=299642 RepID=A0A8X6PBX7_NEPPI|nr:hypothetical protein NPIL_132211 [Nephila pilipes]
MPYSFQRKYGKARTLLGQLFRILHQTDWVPAPPNSLYQARAKDRAWDAALSGVGEQILVIRGEESSQACAPTPGCLCFPSVKGLWPNVGTWNQAENGFETGPSYAPFQPSNPFSHSVSSCPVIRTPPLLRLIKISKLHLHQIVESESSSESTSSPNQPPTYSKGRGVTDRAGRTASRYSLGCRTLSKWPAALLHAPFGAACRPRPQPPGSKRRAVVGTSNSLQSAPTGPPGPRYSGGTTGWVHIEGSKLFNCCRNCTKSLNSVDWASVIKHDEPKVSSSFITIVSEQQNDTTRGRVCFIGRRRGSGV